MKLLLRCLVAMALMLVASPVFAALPDPSHSSCPPTVFLTPGATCCFDVVVRDAIGQPVPGSIVHVDFGACPVIFCPAQPPGVTIVGNGANVTANAAGIAHFCLCATFTPPCTATVTADGILLCSNIPVSNNCNPTNVRWSAWGRLKLLYR